MWYLLRFSSSAKIAFQHCTCKSEFSSNNSIFVRNPKVKRVQIVHEINPLWLYSTSVLITTLPKPPRKKASILTSVVASGPGIGIQLARGEHAGRLIIPFNEGPYGLWSVFAVYSDDRGRTWQIGEPAPGGFQMDDKGGGRSTVNEVQMVERSDGSVLLNSRQFAGRALRKRAVSRDGGATWTTIADDDALRDPSCQASIFRYTEPTAGGHSRILFSNPDSTKRENGTVRLSYDDGRTWPVKKVLHAGSFGYSVLTALPDGTIGCLFESDNASKIVFARFTLDWLTDGKDSLKEP